MTDQMRKRIAELEEALRPFAEAYEREKWLVKHHVHPTEDVRKRVDFATSKVRVDFDDCVRAASLLSAPPPAIDQEKLAEIKATAVERVALSDCPVGLFMSGSGALCLKTEYSNNGGPDAE